VRCWR